MTETQKLLHAQLEAIKAAEVEYNEGNKPLTKKERQEALASAGTDAYWYICQYEATLRVLEAELVVARIKASESPMGRLEAANEMIDAVAKERDDAEAELLATSRELDRWQTGTQIESDFIRANGDVVRDHMHTCPNRLDKLTKQEVFEQFPMSPDEQESFARALDAGIQHVSEILRTKGHISDEDS